MTDEEMVDRFELLRYGFASILADLRHMEAIANQSLSIRDTLVSAAGGLAYERELVQEHQEYLSRIGQDDNTH